MTKLNRYSDRRASCDDPLQLSKGKFFRSILWAILCLVFMVATIKQSAAETIDVDIGVIKIFEPEDIVCLDEGYVPWSEEFTDMLGADLILTNTWKRAPYVGHASFLMEYADGSLETYIFTYADGVCRVALFTPGVSL